MELQGSGHYVKLSSGVNMAININVSTAVWTFFNNLWLVHERAIRRIAKYLMRKSTYVGLPDGNRQLITHGVVYKPDMEKLIWYYVDADFSGGWDQVDADNAENVMLLL